MKRKMINQKDENETVTSLAEVNSPLPFRSVKVLLLPFPRPIILFFSFLFSISLIVSFYQFRFSCVIFQTVSLVGVEKSQTRGAYHQSFPSHLFCLSDLSLSRLSRQVVVKKRKQKDRKKVIEKNKMKSSFQIQFHQSLEKNGFLGKMIIRVWRRHFGPQWILQSSRRYLGPLHMALTALFPITSLLLEEGPRHCNTIWYWNYS